MLRQRQVSNSVNFLLVCLFEKFQRLILVSEWGDLELVKNWSNTYLSDYEAEDSVTISGPVACVFKGWGSGKIHETNANGGQHLVTRLSITIGLSLSGNL